MRVLSLFFVGLLHVVPCLVLRKNYAPWQHKADKMGEPEILPRQMLPVMSKEKYRGIRRIPTSKSLESTST